MKAAVTRYSHPVHASPSSRGIKTEDQRVSQKPRPSASRGVPGAPLPTVWWIIQVSRAALTCHSSGQRETRVMLLTVNQRMEEPVSCPLCLANEYAPFLFLKSVLSDFWYKTKKSHSSSQSRGRHPTFPGVPEFPPWLWLLAPASRQCRPRRGWLRCGVPVTPLSCQLLASAWPVLGVVDIVESQPGDGSTLSQCRSNCFKIIFFKCLKHKLFFLSSQFLLVTNAFYILKLLSQQDFLKQKRKQHGQPCRITSVTYSPNE